MQGSRAVLGWQSFVSLCPPICHLKLALLLRGAGATALRLAVLVWDAPAHAKYHGVVSRLQHAHPDASTSSISDVIVSLFPRGLTLALRSERQDDDFGRGASVMLRIVVPS